MNEQRGIRVLYVAYWGATEPLGQSLVLPAVEELSRRGAQPCLITYEKAADPGHGCLEEQVRARLADRKIAWCALRYHKRPRVPATAYDIARGWLKGVREGRRHQALLVHARTFVGGVIGRAVATTLGVPFIYHNEGFYPDEMVDGGFWKGGSVQYRVAKRLEAIMYDSADGVIVLSHRAASDITAREAVRRRQTPVVVVPSCVDLVRFRRGAGEPPRPEPLRLVYAGAAGGRYQVDRIGRFVAQLARSRSVRLQVLSREPHATIAAMLGAGGLDPALWSLQFVPHSDMPSALAENHAGFSFLARGTSEHGCSPTKIGEYWACGLPVVTSPNVSDTDELVRRFKAGVVVQEHTDEAYRRAGDELRELLRDPELPGRCRAAAEHHYALGPACDRQVALYAQLARKRRGRPA